jgi:hypothetical protein
MVENSTVINAVTEENKRTRAQKRTLSELNDVAVVTTRM